MPYSNLSDDYYDRTEFLSLSRSALALTTEAIVYASRSLTNGFIPRAALRRLTTSTEPEDDAEELVRAEIWTEVGDGWQIPWTGQRTREQVQEDREKDRKRKAHGRGNHSECPEYYTCRAANTSGSDSDKDFKRDVKNPVVTDLSGSDSDKDSTRESRAPIQPNPIQSNPKGLGIGTGSGVENPASPGADAPLAGTSPEDDSASKKTRPKYDWEEEF
ncbi:hypothetical protein [Rhodococcoides yunnanense]|uniref:Uncharacterized protein n=1 Tax=Rhodococcoides yunnanense TaxID=278209 RepID=A0ABU4BDQ9_9NOCA|nr:hypothetical protein [Rhodococcus yunnanensis]MDV6262339.1 hypothetical protein [Rhodococcus yunnanensis]